jgi:hypothetical protein
MPFATGVSPADTRRSKLKSWTLDRSAITIASRRLSPVAV